MAAAEPFGVAVQKSSIHPPSPAAQGMRIGYAPDGTVIYKPVPASSPSPVAFAATGDVAVSAASGKGLGGAGEGEPLKRKRGRPRKYGGPEGGTVALVVSPLSQSAGGGNTPLGSLQPGLDGVKKKGRAPASIKKQQTASAGPAFLGFTPHVMTVKAGEDVSAKILSLSPEGPIALCVLSANGTISNVTLRQAATSGGTVTYEGRFEILSLSGVYLLSDSGSQRTRSGGLSISLAGPDGRVLGGGVAGLLVAASPVQVVVGSFATNSQKGENLSDQTPTMGKLSPIAAIPSSTSLPMQGGLIESSGRPRSPQPPHPNTASALSSASFPGLANFSWK